MVKKQARQTHNLRALVITAPGINCDLELCEGFALAGCTVESDLLARLSRDPTRIDGFDLIGLPGGFSYGDDIAAGRIMAALIRQSIYPALAHAVERGCPIMAPCNGFQIAAQAGLLPGPEVGAAWPKEPAISSIALAPNESGRFNNLWVGMEVPAETKCVWTRHLRCTSATSIIPCAHGEGRFVADDETVEQLEANGQIAMRYTAADHFNGSCNRIAGICDSTGLVFGLMPHPERYLHWTQHPRWTRLSATDREAVPPGLQMFQNAVEHAARTFA
ncbi:MAG: phosphoribosylformylglycinamidine synthase [Phycisphaerales bacterium]|nr:phosphoribosylformylglycinamidine synthase [Phycisphaerales bacterium]